MRKTWVVAMLLSSLWTLPARAAGPAGEFVVSSSFLDYSADPTATMDGRGEALVVWGAVGVPVGRRFAADGTPRGGEFVVGTTSLTYLGPFSAAVDDAGFSVVWFEDSNHRGSATSGRRFDATKHPLTDVISLRPLSGIPVVASDPRGNSVVLGQSRAGLLGQRYDAAGHRNGPAFRVAQGGRGVRGAKVAMDTQGNFTVAWAAETGLFARLFTRAAEPRGPAFRVTRDIADPLLAGNRQGSFVAAWVTDKGVFARPYGPSGAPLRGPVMVSRRSSGYYTSVAMDAAGRFLVTWLCCREEPEPTVFGRYFDASGEPLDEPFQVNLRESPSSPSTFLTSAAGPTSDFLVVWQKGQTADNPRQLLGRRLTWARRGADPCVAAAGALSCDLARDGAEPRVTFPLVRQPGDIPLLGDVDGDRRADPCLYRTGRFLCDTSHDGGAAEVEIAFGLPGDVPLLGDPDGEGRDDACVVRGGQIFCDTAHNGGTAEVVIPAGAPGETTLLGDVDGNGSSDACVLRAGRLLCDTGHDGGGAEAQIPLSLQAGDLLLLADADADGRDDPCVVRANRFLCDRAHSGVLTPLGGTFPAEAGAVPLLGDVNGI